MSDMGNNPSVNKPPIFKNIGKPSKPVTPSVNKANTDANIAEQSAKNIQPNQTNPSQSLANTNSNISLNQTTLTSPVLNQATLNQSPSSLKSSTNTQAQESLAQSRSPGSSDLPAYAGISNISFKSWITEHDSKGFANLASGEKQLAATLEGIKGFQRKNGDNSEERSGRNKYFSILAYMFSPAEHSGSQEIELLTNLFNFKKLDSSNEEKHLLQPPLPDEPQKLFLVDNQQIKYLHQLLALPNELPECVRLFVKNKPEINEHELQKFLEQRLKIVQEQVFGRDSYLSEAIAKFTPLLNQNNFSQLLPLLLLYYPLPPPNIKTDFNFLVEWDKKKKEEIDKKDLIVASCEVYYLSKQRGRFLLKFELNDKHEINFNVQTSGDNDDVINALEAAVSESMFLLANPPLLSEFNVLLTKEIHKTISNEEELSIASTGPLRIEIVLSVYSVLTVLNKLCG